jgi:short-subunit dehydrogenase
MTRTVLVVGSSDGIGLAVARALTARGDRVIGISRSATPVPGMIHEIHDVASPDYMPSLARIDREHGPFDVCVYCAGIGSELELPDFSRETRVFDVNLTAAAATLAALAPGWIARRTGHFVGLSSLADCIYNPGAPSYSASKAAMSTYLVSMGLKLRPAGVSVTNVRFGFVDTKMAKAPIRPMMLTPERAAAHVLECLNRKPLQLTTPRMVAAFLGVVRVAQCLRVWAG